MPRGQPVDPEVRARVLELHGQGHTRNAIAREADVSGYTVTKIVHAAGRTFDREETRAATAARRDDSRARRAQLASDLLDDAARLRAQLWQPTRHGAFGGRDNVWNEVQLEQPLFADKRSITAALGNLVRDHVRLEQVDATNGAEQQGSMLLTLQAQISDLVVAEQEQPDPEEED